MALFMQLIQLELVELFGFCRSGTDLTSIVSLNRQSAVHVSASPYFASIDETSSMMGSISRQSGQHQFQDSFPGSVDITSQLSHKEG